MCERDDPQAQINSATSPLEPFEVPDANIIIRSSDNIDFRVHKSLLAMASPFFKDLLSLPQPSDREIVDGLPAVRLPESSELLSCLISIIYPVPTVMPNSYEKVLYPCDMSAVTTNPCYKVLYLLAACQKYDMNLVQSSIRAEVNRRGASLAPEGAEAFSAYAIATAKGLIPEMEDAAYLTLFQPMTFEILGEGLRFFQGWALRDLANFRKRYIDNVITCLESFLEVVPPGPSSIWVGCPEVMLTLSPSGIYPTLPTWLYQLFSRSLNEWKHEKFTRQLRVLNSSGSSSAARLAYVKALSPHETCSFCLGVDRKHGLTFCAELENRLAEARKKVSHFLYFSTIAN